MSTKSTSHERTSRNFHNDVLKKESIDKAHADKNNTVKEEREKKDYMICKYTSNSYTTLHEAILIGNIPYFLTLKGDEISIVEKIELDDMNLIPHNRTN